MKFCARYFCAEIQQVEVTMKIRKSSIPLDEKLREAILAAFKAGS